MHSKRMFNAPARTDSLLPAIERRCIACLFAMALAGGSGSALANSVQTRRDTLELALGHVQTMQWPHSRALPLPLFLERPSYDMALELGQAEHVGARRKQDIALRLAEHRVEYWTSELAAEQDISRSVTLVPVTSTARPTLEPDKDSDAGQSRFRSVSYAPLVVGGLMTVVGAATGLGMHVMRNSRQRESSDIRSRLGRAGCASVEAASVSGDCDRLVTLAAEYDAYGKIELIGFLVSGASLLATGGYYLAARSEPTDQRSTQIRANFTARASSVDILVPF